MEQADDFDDKARKMGITHEIKLDYSNNPEVVEFDKDTVAGSLDSTTYVL